MRFWALYEHHTRHLKLSIVAMKSDLEPAKNLLRSFLTEIEAVREMQCGISAPTFSTSFSVKDCTPDFNTNEAIVAFAVWFAYSSRILYRNNMKAFGKNFPKERDAHAARC